MGVSSIAVGLANAAMMAALLVSPLARADANTRVTGAIDSTSTAAFELHVTFNCQGTPACRLHRSLVEREPVGLGDGDQVFTAGTVSLAFTDANNAMLAYTVNGVTSSKTITRQIF